MRRHKTAPPLPTTRGPSLGRLPPDAIVDSDVPSDGAQEPGWTVPAWAWVVLGLVLGAIGVYAFAMLKLMTYWSHS